MNDKMPPKRKESPRLDNIRRRIPVILSLSDLQSEILRHICTTVNPNYGSLVKEIGKDRITILQSLESLIEHRYVVKQKVNPNYEKSKLFFTPTHKGISYAFLNLKVDIKTIVNSSNDEIGTYIEFVRETFHSSQHYRQMLEPMFRELERGYVEVYEDNTAKKKELVKDCFCMGLLSSAQHKNYDANILFSNNSTRWLNKLFSSEELRELKEVFSLAGNNLIKTSERIPV
jgi:predicted transcriptional regulator